jgi:hypothetical protein
LRRLGGVLSTRGALARLGGEAADETRGDGMNSLLLWCERGDSNPHGLPRQILSLVRLPIPPLSHTSIDALAAHHRSWTVLCIVLAREYAG